MSYQKEEKVTTVEWTRIWGFSSPILSSICVPLYYAHTQAHNVTCIHIKGHTRLFPLDFISFSYLIFPLHHMCLCVCVHLRIVDVDVEKAKEDSVQYCSVVVVPSTFGGVSAQLFLHASS